MKRTSLALLALGILAVVTVGCKSNDGSTDAPAVQAGTGIEAGETKTGAGGGGAAAVDAPVAAPPGVKTGTPGG